MKASKAAIALAVLLVFALGTLPASAADIRIVRLSLVEGDIQIDRGTGAGPETALMNMPVTHGTRLFTNDTEARLEIEFENGSPVRLAGPGEIDFKQLSMTANGSKVSVIEVIEGVVYGNIRMQNDDDFRITFNGEEVTLRKSSRFRIWLDGGKTDLSVFKGEIQLQGHAGMVLVKKGETLTLQDEERERYFLAQSIVPYDSDAWNKSRDDYANQYKNASVYSNVGMNYGGPYSYGIGDMAYYGSFINAPGCGAMWRPFGVGAGWDPFMNGAWSYYPGTGWVFISGSPWGWMPFRYGSWTYVAGLGWGWLPGPYSHWAPVPPIVNTPPRYQPPRPPSAGPGATVLVSGGAPPRPIGHLPAPRGAVSGEVSTGVATPLLPGAVMPGRPLGAVPGMTVPPRTGGSGGVALTPNVGSSRAPIGGASVTPNVGTQRAPTSGSAANQSVFPRNRPGPMRQAQPPSSGGSSVSSSRPTSSGGGSTPSYSGAGRPASGGGNSGGGRSYSGGGSSSGSSGGGHSSSGGGYSGGGGGGRSYSGGGSSSSGSSSSGGGGGTAPATAPSGGAIGLKK